MNEAQKVMMSVFDRGMLPLWPHRRSTACISPRVAVERWTLDVE